MRNATMQASLSASLMHRTDRASGPAAAIGAVTPSPGAYLPRSSLFCRKGEASAETFRSLRYSTVEAVAAPAGTAAATVQAAEPSPKCGEGRRLWVRVTPARRQALKDAAAAHGQSCQAFLVGALDALLEDVAGPLGIDTHSLRVLPKPAALHLLPKAKTNRVKLACWVDADRRAKTLVTAQRLGQTVQALLEAALDKHLDRSALAMIRPVPARPSHPMVSRSAPATSRLSLLVAAGVVQGSLALAHA